MTLNTISFPQGASRPIRIRIDPSALSHNLACLRARLACRDSVPRLWATVKADAYGHGLARLLPTLRAADGLAVLDLRDAWRAIEHGWTGRILVLAGLYNADEANHLPDLPLDLVITSNRQLHWLALAEPQHAPALWLRYCSDMHHGGFDEKSYRDAYRHACHLRDTRRASFVGHLSHYACAENAVRRDACDVQFDRVIADLPGPVSRANSAAVLGDASARPHENWVRTGLALYGASPLPGISAEALGLRPVMKLTTEVIAVRKVQTGASVGYGGDFVAPRPMRIGVVAAGYADGYPRYAPTGTPVCVGRLPSRVLGRVGMDSMAIDLTDLPHADPGAEVTLWGTSELPVETIAQAAGTISAQLLCGVNPRIAVQLC
ncbi:alanine racemase [Achromobacter marplatensis]|uniref:alanine racemase n=1 Tax=Achromobacter marplatensis TaxID=470868 RepID=UPI0039F661B9